MYLSQGNFSVLKKCIETNYFILSPIAPIDKFSIFAL